MESGQLPTTCRQFQRCTLRSWIYLSGLEGSGKTKGRENGPYIVVEMSRISLIFFRPERIYRHGELDYFTVSFSSQLAVDRLNCARKMIKLLGY